MSASYDAGTATAVVVVAVVVGFAVDDAKQIEIKSKCNRARKAESRKQSHYRHIGVKVPRPRATRLQSTPPPPRLDPQ